MRPGSVIVDLAAETGGNVELTKAGETVEHNGVKIMGQLNLPSTMPVHASQMYAKNIQNLLDLLVKNGKLDPDFEDEIVKGTVITRGGDIVHEMTKQRVAEQDSSVQQSSGSQDPVSVPDRERSEGGSQVTPATAGAPSDAAAAGVKDSTA
jgi:alanine dehydrogenase